ncbi:MAG: hypothetical protein ACYCTL_02500 [Acidimicrobiales bacterium]
MPSSEKPPGLRGVFAVCDEPGHVAPGESSVVLEPAFEFRDPGGPAAEGVGDPLEADASALYEAGPGVKGMIVGARAADGAGVKVERPQQGEDERP